MKPAASRTLLSHSLLFTALSILPLAVTGCGVGNLVAPNSTDTAITAFSGTIHGGPNPVIGARVVLYNTTSGGYGVGHALQGVTSDANGNFSFSGNACPAGQYAYIVAYGGNTGGNTNNPNSLLMAALGPCSSLYTGTTYTGPNVLMNELTTLAAGYALGNFITITGNALTSTNGGSGTLAGNSYTVGIGSSSTNNGTAGCVSNGYYGTANCATTVAAGLKHAFANAVALVSPFTGAPATTSANGAMVPFQEINTLGNVLQTCVNSTGGGTDTTGAPSAAITSSGATTYVGTSTCAKLFAYATYSSNGTSTGAITSAGNTLQAVMNLAKRPSGTATLFDTGCSSGGTGSTAAATCIYNLSPSTGFYQASMASAPPDWMMAISYPKGSFSGGATAATCSQSPTTYGTLYPLMAATDINDNIVILNGDASPSTCYNLITIGTDGTLLASRDYDATSATPVWVSTDAFGHAIVPVHATENGIRIYGATDSGVPLLNYVTATTNLPTSYPYYTAVDQYDGIYMTAQPSANTTTTNFGYMSVSGSAESHSSPAYNAVLALGSASTSKLNIIDVDIAGNALTTNSSSSGTGSTRVAAAAGGFGTTTASTVTSGATLTGSSSNGQTTAADISGNVYSVQTPNSSSYTASASAPSTTVIVDKQTYTAGAGATPTVGTATNTTVNSTVYKPQPGQIDGNNVIWYADLQGSTSASGVTPVFIYSSTLHGYDTVNSFGTAGYQGCRFTTSASTACGSQSTDTTYPSGTPYVLFGTRGLAIDAAGSIWLANGTQGEVNEIIGLATPTWPLFLHNGSSNKP